MHLWWDRLWCLTFKAATTFNDKMWSLCYFFGSIYKPLEFTDGRRFKSSNQVKTKINRRRTRLVVIEVSSFWKTSFLSNFQSVGKIYASLRKTHSIVTVWFFFWSIPLLFHGRVGGNSIRFHLTAGPDMGSQFWWSAPLCKLAPHSVWF